MEYKLLALFIVFAFFVVLFIQGKILNKKKNFKNGFILMAISFITGVVLLLSAITMI